MSDQTNPDPCPIALTVHFEGTKPPTMSVGAETLLQNEYESIDELSIAMRATVEHRVASRISELDDSIRECETFLAGARREIRELSTWLRGGEAVAKTKVVGDLKAKHIARVRKMRGEGLSANRIAQQIGVSRTTVRRWLGEVA